MANRILTLNDANILFADYTQNVLNLTQDKVLISYPDKGQKAPTFTDNVVFIHVDHEQSDVYNYKNRKKVGFDPITEKDTIEQTAMRVLCVEFVFYGSESDSLLIKLNESFYSAAGKFFLDTNNLAIIPENTEMTNKIHENINGRWWDRSDLRIRFYNSISVDNSVDTFASSEISIVTRF